MVKETTKKPTTRAKATPEIETVEEPIKVTTKTVAKTVKEEKPKKFNQTEGVPCRSVVVGKLFMDGIRSSIPYQWMDFDDVIDVEYRDLVAAVKEKNSFVMKPFFVILDDDFLKEFPVLNDVYEKQYSTRDLSNILRLSVPQMTEEIGKLPANVKETLKSIAATWVGNGTLDSMKKIKALDEIFETDLGAIADLIDE